MNRIKELRITNDLFQRDVENALNIGRGTLSNYENEKRMLTPELIGKLCDIFGVTADYLLCRSDNPVSTVPPEDLALLQAYHAASERDRGLVDQILQPAAVSKERPA